MNAKKISIQEYLSLGYVFLLILGIISDSIFYKFLGLNILSYSSILDVLISPISLLTSNLIMLVAITTMISFGCLITFKFKPWYHKKYRDKNWYQKFASKSQIAKWDKKYESPPSINGIMMVTASMIFSMYLGLGIGRGQKISDKIKDGTLKPNHTLYFDSNDEIDVNIVGQNSLYLFYVEKGNTKLTISPIEANINKIVKLEIEEENRKIQ